MNPSTERGPDNHDAERNAKKGAPLYPEILVLFDYFSSFLGKCVIPGLVDAHTHVLFISILFRIACLFW